MERRIDKCLSVLRKWAETRVASGDEPPWAWYQYMKLIETVAAIQVGRASVNPSRQVHWLWSHRARNLAPQGTELLI